MGKFCNDFWTVFRGEMAKQEMRDGYIPQVDLYTMQMAINMIQQLKHAVKEIGDVLQEGREYKKG